MDKCFRVNGETRFNISIFFPKWCILWDNWKNTEQPERPQTTVQYSAEKMSFAYWVTEAKNTYSAYVILTALPQR